jgi:hypothetical protein
MTKSSSLMSSSGDGMLHVNSVKWEDGSSFGGSQDSLDSRGDISVSLPPVSTPNDTTLDGGLHFRQMSSGSISDHGNPAIEEGLVITTTESENISTQNDQSSNEQSNASLQPKLLRKINSYHSKEDLLRLVSSYHSVLDEINLVTCVYRLARMYSSIRNPAARSRWSMELRNDNSFLQLLGAIQGHMLHAQLQLIEKGSFKGLDAQCLSNLIWAMVKLDVSSEPCSPGYEVVQNASPLVMYFLSNSSSQGLANLLWAYSKMSVPLMDVMMMIVAEMANRLHSVEGVTQFDAQALSNSIWALAHMRSKPAELDIIAGIPGLTMHFMFGISECASNMLKGLRTRSDLSHMQASMQQAEKKFSCQALVNICWSLSSMLGADCIQLPNIKGLFMSIRSEAMVRLRATTTALQLKQAWALRAQGGFNEQALSNIVYAFDRATLLDHELLQAVYAVAAMRLEASTQAGLRPAFKSQEMCTLLRAAQTNIAQPWEFLNKLCDAIAANPHMIDSWSAAERGELQRAVSLLDVYRTTLALQQLKLARQLQLQQQLYSPANALAAQLSSLSLAGQLGMQPGLPPHLGHQQQLGHLLPPSLNLGGGADLLQHLQMMSMPRPGAF